MKNEILALTFSMACGAIVSLVIGGQHITLLPGSIRDCFDYAIRGEGELPFLEFIEGREVRNHAPINIANYPKLNWNLIDQRYFNKRFSEGAAEWCKFGLFLSSRGCPYNCMFCGSPKFWTGVRMFSPEWMIREVIDLAARGITHLTIFDDIFTLGKERLRRFAELKREAGLGHIKMMGCSRVNMFDDELCQILKELNFITITFGFDSIMFTVSRKLLGAKVYLDIPDHLVWLLKKQLSDGEAWPKVREGDTVWDVGCNCGIFSVIAAKSGARQVIAFDVCYRNIELLARTAHKNSLNIVPVCSPITIEPDFWEASHGAHPETEMRGGRFPTMTVCDAVRRFGVPNLIKMDIQGSEKPFLESESWREWLEANRITWYVELHNLLTPWKDMIQVGNIQWIFQP